MTRLANDPNYEECIVTFIDILGFRDLLDTKTAAEIRQILDIFRREAVPYDDGESIDPSQPRLTSEVKTEAISDAVVRARTIHTNYRDGALFHELLDLVFIQAACIEKGILLRGALTIDYAHVGQALEGPVFGPGLVKAYQMEEREAIYPRIIIEEAVIERFENDRSLWKEGHHKSQEAAYLGDLLKTDEAGLKFVDYLGAVETEMDDYGSYLEFLQRHKELVERGLSVTSRREVRRKYAWLKNYHDSQVKHEMDKRNLDDFQPDLEGTLREFLEPLVVA